jgi:hypothetical protein
MGEKKISIQELAQKVDELLNVLNVIAGDLSEVSQSLKSVSESAVALATPPVKKRNLKDVKEAFSSELAGMLLFEEREHFFVVKPRRFLGSDNFAKIASIVRNLSGEYVSAGKNSHFNVPKEVG